MPKTNLGSESLWAIPITFGEKVSCGGTTPGKLTFIASKIRHRVPKSNLGPLLAMQIMLKVVGAGDSPLGKTTLAKLTPPPKKKNISSPYMYICNVT